VKEAMHAFGSPLAHVRTRARTDRGAGASSVRVASVVSFTSRTRDGAEADAAQRSVQEVGVFFSTLF
jgi:hypothetical protein